MATDPADQRHLAAELSQPDMELLTDVAEALADAEDPGRTFWDVYDPMRSSSGQEYVLGPDAAGWYSLAPDGRAIQVAVSYIRDPALAHEVRMELDERYALAHSDEEEDVSRDGSADYEHDSGTPPEADVDDIPGSCDITGG